MLPSKSRPRPHQPGGGTLRLTSMIAVSVLAAALTVEAQPPGRIPRVAVVWIAAAPAVIHMHDAFRHGLRERGWVEGHTVAVEARHTDGKPERLPAIMAETRGFWGKCDRRSRRRHRTSRHKGDAVAL